MFRYDERTHTIVLTRGDTGLIDFGLNVVDENCEAIHGYTATFHLKHSTRLADELLIERQLEKDVLYFTHDDTKHLEDGLYWYDIEIHYGESVQTLGPYRLQLRPDVG